jgi:hypothetical protein
VGATAIGTGRELSSRRKAVSTSRRKRIRPIDHLVLPVTTLTLARSQLTGLGFNVAPDAQHSFGTGNCCVFFQDRSFLEPITILDRAAADMAAAEGLFFVKRIKRFTERQGEGFAMLAMTSDDIEADRADVERLGTGAGPAFRFARMATAPDGTRHEVGFAVAALDGAAAADASFFLCQHFAQDVLFQPKYLEHPNGALGIAAVSAVAENPADFHILLGAASGRRELRSTSFGVEAAADGRSIAILTPAGFRARYGVEPPDPRRGLRFAAFDLIVADLDRALGHAGARAQRREDGVIVPPSPGLGAVIALRTGAHG